MDLGTYINAVNQQFEEVLDEDLYQDGELNERSAMVLAWSKLSTGEYKLIRRIDG